MSVVAEFREFIRPAICPAIPQIITFFNHSDLNVREAGINALAKLSEQGRTSHFLV